MKLAWNIFSLHLGCVNHFHLPIIPCDIYKLVCFFFATAFPVPCLVRFLFFSPKAETAAFFSFSYLVLPFYLRPIPAPP